MHNTIIFVVNIDLLPAIGFDVGQYLNNTTKPIPHKKTPKKLRLCKFVKRGEFKKLVLDMAYFN